MSFGDHLEELRRRLVLALVAPLPLAIVAFFFSRRLVELLLLPLFDVLAYHNLPQQVQALSPPEMVLAQLKLSIIFGFVAAGPWILWQAWKFIGPGLFAHEKRFVYFLVPGSAILTVAGASLLYFVMLPLILHVLIMFGAALQQPVTVVPVTPEDTVAEMATDAARAMAGAGFFEVVEDDPISARPGQAWIKMPERVLRIAVTSRDGSLLEIFELALWPPSRLVQQFRVSEYINFVLMLLLGMVIAFQMPLVIVLLGWLGIVTVPWLRGQRRYALLVCAVVAAVITPADAISMMAMLLPLYGLYELGILLLVIAPAGAVAEGRFRWRGSRSDKARPRDKETTPPSQSTKSIPRDAGERDEEANVADDAGDDRDGR